MQHIYSLDETVTYIVKYINLNRQASYWLFINYFGLMKYASVGGLICDLLRYWVYLFGTNPFFIWGKVEFSSRRLIELYRMIILLMLWYFHLGIWNFYYCLQGCCHHGESTVERIFLMADVTTLTNSLRQKVWPIYYHTSRALNLLDRAR